MNLNPVSRKRLKAAEVSLWFISVRTWKTGALQFLSEIKLDAAFCSKLLNELHCLHNTINHTKLVPNTEVIKMEIEYSLT